MSYRLEMVAEVMEARNVSLMFFNEDGTELMIRAAHGLDPDMVARARVKTGASIAGWVAQTCENLLVNDIDVTATRSTSLIASPSPRDSDPRSNAPLKSSGCDSIRRTVCSSSGQTLSVSTCARPGQSCIPVMFPLTRHRRRQGVPVQRR